jgi:hypothetical protein
MYIALLNNSNTSFPINGWFSIATQSLLIETKTGIEALMQARLLEGI